MVSYTRLEIQGYEGREVPNTFLRADDPADTLAVLLPGYGYRATMPALYYPERVLVARGADVLRVEYAYDQEPAFRLVGEGWLHWLMADAQAALETGLAQGDYAELYLVGKSIGTFAQGELLAQQPGARAARCVWLTPILGNARLTEQVLQARPRSLFVVGTADSHYDPESLARWMEATGGESVVIAGGDHSLEIAGDVAASVRAMLQLVEALERFVAG